MTQAPLPRHTLQSLLLPAVGLGTEPDVYVRLEGAAALSLQQRHLQFNIGGLADFGTYGNLFNLERWHQHCVLKDLSIALSGRGRFELSIRLARAEHSTEWLFSDVITLTEGTAHQQPVPVTDLTTKGVIHVVLRALDEGAITGLDWQTTDAPRRTPDLLLSVTTFRREEAVRATVARFEEFMTRSRLSDHLHLAVVDNGQTAGITSTTHVTAIDNENLGGSGGFARGLLEAQNRNFSHCLFMDDDASVHMEAIERTWSFLAYAKNEMTAVAGAVAHSRHRWMLWENGALFNQVCQPLHGGLDLRDPDRVTNMEHDSAGTRPHNFYGGWWYFAFPVAKVQHMPFPFFVRGDDVSFSLAHEFNIVTLNGVISFQDEDFTIKETPQTVYLDLRSHLAHHLSLASMDIGRVGIFKIILRFYLRALLACHYETLAASNLALQDVLEGPEFFRANADMTKRRADIGDLTQDERWEDESKARQSRQPDRQPISPHRLWPRLLMKASFNGLFLPGFARFGNRITLPAEQRGWRRPLWGAARITYVSTDGRRSYTVRHSKARAWAESRMTFKAMCRFWRNHDQLVADWRKGYAELTTDTYWQDRLKVSQKTSAPENQAAQ